MRDKIYKELMILLYTMVIGYLIVLAFVYANKVLTFMDEASKNGYKEEKAKEVVDAIAKTPVPKGTKTEVTTSDD